MRRSEEKGERREEFKFLAKFYRIPLFVFLIHDTRYLILKRKEFKFLAKFYRIPPFVFRYTFKVLEIYHALVDNPDSRLTIHENPKGSILNYQLSILNSSLAYRNIHIIALSFACINLARATDGFVCFTHFFPLC